MQILIRKTENGFILSVGDERQQHAQGKEYVATSSKDLGRLVEELCEYPVMEVRADG